MVLLTSWSYRGDNNDDNGYDYDDGDDYDGDRFNVCVLIYVKLFMW